jgi:hypothetical protein
MPARTAWLVCANIDAKPFCSHYYSLYPFWNLGKMVAGYPGFDWKGAITTRVPKLHVRHLFGRVRPRTWRFEGFLDRTIIIF